MFDKVLAVVNGVVSAGISAVPLIGPLGDLIDKLGEDRALTPEERDNLHQALNEAIKNREERVPLTERYKPPEEPAGEE